MFDRLLRQVREFVRRLLANQPCNEWESLTFGLFRSLVFQVGRALM
jgi:hypothetical protein